MFDTEKLTGEEALMEAQKIAFAPIVFQCAHLLRKWGILELLHKNRRVGLSVDELSQELNISTYGAHVVCESGYSMGALKYQNERYYLTKIGYFLQFDEMTSVNFNFNLDVNYHGIDELEESIKTASPRGLQKYFGKEFETIYPHLLELPDSARKSWFEFDHFYSDAAFAKLVQIVSDMEPTKLLDVGGNTGKWAVAITRASKQTEVTILDHKLQLKAAHKRAIESGVEDRVKGVHMDLLDHSIEFPKGFDIVWMSQFLDCFGVDDIVSILKRAKRALNNKAKVYIVEPYWDRQSVDLGSYALINTSPYFTALANGKSKMYSAIQMHECIKESGLTIEHEIDHIGFGHTLSICS